VVFPKAFNMNYIASDKTWLTNYYLISIGCIPLARYWLQKSTIVLIFERTSTRLFFSLVRCFQYWRYFFK